MLETITGTGDIKTLNVKGNYVYTTEKDATIGISMGSTTAGVNTVIDDKTNRPRVEIDRSCPKESFKIICDLIRKQLVTYDEAWSLLLDIMPKEKEYVKEYVPSQPFTLPIYPDYPNYKPPTIWCGDKTFSTAQSCVCTNMHDGCHYEGCTTTSADANKEFVTPTKTTE